MAKQEMKVFSRLTTIGIAAAALLASAGAALAGLGQPSPWQMGLQDSASPVMDDITGFNTFLFWLTS
ncbi:MAG: cytochrome c oxidase subunit II, partial [Xanthobacteraceae bacterium]